jgi:hypothetical protein
MSKESNKKWQQVYEDEDETVIWKYDTSKTTFGPYEVEIKYKKPVPKIKKVTTKVTIKK